MESIDIIILTYQRLQFIKEQIEELKSRTKYPYRLIVVDNGSTDGTREWIKSKYKRGEIWKYVFTKENLFMSNAYAEGFKKVESELFITTTDDVIPPKKDPCWLTQLVDLINNNPEYSSITMGCGQTSFIKFLKRKYGNYKNSI